MCVDAHGAHRREVNHKSTVADRVASHVVPAGANGEKQSMFASKDDGRDNVCDTMAAGYQIRPTIYHSVSRSPEWRRMLHRRAAAVCLSGSP